MIVDFLPASVNPAYILIFGGLLIPLIPRPLRQIYMLALPIVGAIHFFGYPMGSYGEVALFDFTMTLMRIDGLSRIFCVIFFIATALNIIYAWHVRDTLQQVASVIYPGTAIGGVLAGDLVTLFIFWELATISSVFLVWAGRTERAMRASMRYLVLQVMSGVLLLAGLILYAQNTGSIAFNLMELSSFPVLLIFLAFGIKSAFPLLHNWVQDSYPESTVSGTLVLSIFTTKLAVYSLARGFAGTEQLIWIGAIMTLFPIFFAVIEDNLRRVLTYSINNQVGFMVVAIGVGTPLAINGAAGYAFCNIIFEGLLFMSMGAVLYRTGTVQASELGGIYKSMPLTAFFCIIGALSIAAFPLFSGFVVKGLILDAVSGEHLIWIWGILLFASAGVLEHAGIKIPYFAFFAHDSGKRCEEAPWGMLIAMGISAVLTVAIGVYPAPLFALLPYPIDVQSYTPGHIITQLQLLLFAVLAFVFLIRVGVYPPEIKSTNLDTDWFYRKLAPGVLLFIGRGLGAAQHWISVNSQKHLDQFIGRLYRFHGPESGLARSWPAGHMALWIAILLGVTLILNYF